MIADSYPTAGTYVFYANEKGEIDIGALADATSGRFSVIARRGWDYVLISAPAVQVIDDILPLVADHFQADFADVTADMRAYARAISKIPEEDFDFAHAHVSAAHRRLVATPAFSALIREAA